MNRVRLLLLAHTVVAGAVSLVTGWAGSGIVLCVVPPLLLMRFVWLDREPTMTGAMLFTALLAVMANSAHGGGAAVTVSLGGFVAAEIAARGARIRRAAPLPRLRADLVPTLAVVAVAAAATMVTLALTWLRVPAIASVAGLTLLVTGLFVVSFGLDRSPAPGVPHDHAEAVRKR